MHLDHVSFAPAHRTFGVAQGSIPVAHVTGEVKTVGTEHSMFGLGRQTQPDRWTNVPYSPVPMDPHDPTNDA